MRKSLFYFMFAFLALSSLGFDFFKGSPKIVTPAPDAMVNPNDKIEESPFFKKILEKDGDPELAKIQFLISRVRESPYIFVRNGTDYKGERAAVHLAWKFRRKPGG